ncbi:unnamed protein product [Victoria cruziana]
MTRSKLSRPVPQGSHNKPAAGIVSRIRLENFMCHSNIEIEFGDWVNFITGQNGSGKSAILTALCIAFGIRARSTQRASSLKDFIKNGCSYALVVVEIKNNGEDGFKKDIYGDSIILERRITESTSTTILKDCQGKKISQKKDDLRELIEHFNIDVENPCVIMSQDRSREFLHSGNDKEKFKFFFKATLLQQVSELLQNIKGQLDAAYAIVDDLESSIRPILKELDELQEKIKSMEHVEEISRRVQQLKKKLAWSWVYDVDRQIEDLASKIDKLKGRIPTCQAKIDRQVIKVDELNIRLLEKKEKIAGMMEKTVQVRNLKDELQQNLSQATRVKLELDQEIARRTGLIQISVRRLDLLSRQIQEIQDQHIRSTQAEESEMEEQLMVLQSEVDSVTLDLERLKGEENQLLNNVSATKDALNEMIREIEENERKRYDISSHIRSLQQQSTNKVTAFGGDKVLNLLRIIERHHRRFRKAPIGPIGAHVALLRDDVWALAIEHAIGKLLNAFIVTNHKDSLVLRECAKEANYHNLQIVIYNFDRPLLNIPNNMLPQTDHPTTISVIHTEIPTIINVLVDQGNAERQVLVQGYDVGKSVAFEQKIPNLKEVYTVEGCRMFQRGSVQTILPPNRRIRTGRLCGSVDERIKELEEEASRVSERVRAGQKRKTDIEKVLKEFDEQIQYVKRQRLDTDRFLASKNLKLRELKNVSQADVGSEHAPNVDELHKEIEKVKDEMHEKEIEIEKLRARLIEAQEKASEFRQSFENLCESVKGEMDTFAEAEHQIVLIEDDLNSAQKEKAHYEGIMQQKVLPDIKEAEELYQQLKQQREESYKKASIICLESELESLGGCKDSTPEQLSAQLSRLKDRLDRESKRFDETIDDLRMMYEVKERKILHKKQVYADLHEKLNACQKALEMRWNKFERNAILLKRQLTWQFNGHLRKKGFSGHIKVDYEEKTLSIEVKMPQDASGRSVQDTRGLSGGERSFSTLCFALALHEMTEAPFRAMDEFDVFMDAVSRKISLDTLVEFAVAQGSQWIFISPHDISMVKAGERVKKQQMAAPRS